MAAPRVAISPNRKTVDYERSVVEAGGDPLVVDLSSGSPATLLDGVGALLLTGGGDIDPALFGEDRHPAFQEAEPGRDALEIALLLQALATGLPVLAICRGVQVLNVAFGGTLVEHLPDEVGEKVLHRGPERAYVPHEVRLEPRSRLAALLGAQTLSPASSHHQAVRKPGAGLEVVARAGDGTIEALEHREHERLIAVQWHPEYTAHEDPRQQRLFEELVRWAR
jgi:putative glutamine amidotransferase